MAKLYVKSEELLSFGVRVWYTEATPAEIDEAAGVTKLRAQVAAANARAERAEADAEVGRAIKEYFARIEGRYLVSAKMEISVHRYDMSGLPEAHWNIQAAVTSGYNHIEDGGIWTDGKDKPDNPELRDALISAGLIMPAIAAGGDK
jgi:hypothetical protein